MASDASEGSAEHNEYEAAFAIQLAAADPQLAPLCDALLERSWARTLLGDRDGALEDAERAQALLPTRSKCLIRLSRALLETRQPNKAHDVFLRAADLFGEGWIHDDTLLDLARRLRPFERLPDDVCARVFEFVMQDTERLPSPFQIAHVSPRWRRIAYSTPSLWRDLDILRISDRAYVSREMYFPAIRKCYRLSETAYPKSGYFCTIKDGSQYNLMAVCTDLSQDSLKHFELEIHDYAQASELVNRLFSDTRRSKATLRTIAIAHTHAGERRTHGERQSFMQSFEMQSASPFATLCLDLVLQCPELLDVELCIGAILHGGETGPQLTEAALSTFSASPLASLRRLKLDSIGGFSNAQGAQARDILLYRAATLRTLAFDNVPCLNLDALAIGKLPFALELLLTCADTLVELEICGQANLLAGVTALGVSSFPSLRSFRLGHRDSAPLGVGMGSMEGLALPRLATLEAPIDIIASFPCVPSNVVIRFDSEDASGLDCINLEKWLLSFPMDYSPSSLTVLVTHQGRSDNIIHALFNSLTLKRCTGIVCPALEKLKIIHRTAFSPDATGNRHSMDPVALPTPVWRAEWEALSDVSIVAKVPVERRRLARESPWLLWSNLRLIELESCFVSDAAWEEMKATAPSFKFVVRPNPDDMARLR